MVSHIFFLGPSANSCLYGPLIKGTLVFAVFAVSVEGLPRRASFSVFSGAFHRVIWISSLLFVTGLAKFHYEFRNFCSFRNFRCFVEGIQSAHLHFLTTQFWSMVRQNVVDFCIIFLNFRGFVKVVPSLLRGYEWGGAIVGCRLKFSYFVGGPVG